MNLLMVSLAASAWTTSVFVVDCASKTHGMYKSAKVSKRNFLVIVLTPHECLITCVGMTTSVISDRATLWIEKSPSRSFGINRRHLQGLEHSIASGARRAGPRPQPESQLPGL